MPSDKHNPERRAWRGRSYKKGGKPVKDIKAEPPHHDHGPNYDTHEEREMDREPRDNNEDF